MPLNETGISGVLCQPLSMSLCWGAPHTSPVAPPLLPCALSHGCCAAVVLLCSPRPSSLLTLEAQAQQCQCTPVLGSPRALPISITSAPRHRLARLGSTLMSHLCFPSTPMLSHPGRAGNSPVFSSPKTCFAIFFQSPVAHTMRCSGTSSFDSPS